MKLHTINILSASLGFVHYTLITGTTQGRLRMVGGLQILVYALKELLTEQAKETTNRVVLTDLAVHIVQALSAAIFMHGMYSWYRIAGNFRGVLIFVIFVVDQAVTKFSTHQNQFF